MGNVRHRIGWEKLKQVEKFKYLGRVFVRIGGCKEDVKTRCLRAAQVFSNFHLHLATQSHYPCITQVIRSAGDPSYCIVPLQNTVAK